MLEEAVEAPAEAAAEAVPDRPFEEVAEAPAAEEAPTDEAPAEEAPAEEAEQPEVA